MKSFDFLMTTENSVCSYLHAILGVKNVEGVVCVNSHLCYFSFSKFLRSPSFRLCCIFKMSMKSSTVRVFWVEKPQKKHGRCQTFPVRIASILWIAILFLVCFLIRPMHRIANKKKLIQRRTDWFPDDLVKVFVKCGFYEILPLFFTTTTTATAREPCQAVLIMFAWDTYSKRVTNSHPASVILINEGELPSRFTILHLGRLLHSKTSSLDLQRAEE